MVATEDKEQAFFGGWKLRPVAGGSHKWGPPEWRVQEFIATAVSDVVLPPHGPWLQLGVPYYVINSSPGPAGSSASISVKRPIDGASVGGLGPGEAAVAIPSVGGSWVWMALGSFGVGVPYPSLRYTVEISQNVANFNLLEAVIAQGYDGTAAAAVTCRVRAGAAVGSTQQGLRSWTTGNTVGSVSWLAASFAFLVIEVDAAGGGWGGNGGRSGIPGTGSSSGFDGQAGGQAIRNEIPLFIDCHGSLFGGGGGGGGGGSSASNVQVAGGGGGGGRGMNMAANGTIIGSAGGAAAAPGQPGTGGGAFVSGGGGYGSGGGGLAGNGGAAATSGGGGAAAPGAGSGGAGGAAGAAISYLPAAGAPTILGGGGNIIGATVSEAS